jgi:ABC-2 type transport system permease protein
MLVIVGIGSMMLGPWLLMLGPMTMQRGMRQTLEQMDILKASPLRGWQIVLGELLTPMVVMTFSLWFLLIGAHESFGALVNGRLDVTPYLSPGLVAIALLAPPLCGLMMCVPFAGFVYFPAWTVSASSSRGGIEAMGQRMIFLAGYLLTLIVVLIPALLLGGLAFLVMKWLAGLAATLLTTGLIASATLALELVIAVEWLGRRVDRFDVSQELR